MEPPRSGVVGMAGVCGSGCKAVAPASDRTHLRSATVAECCPGLTRDPGPDGMARLLAKPAVVDGVGYGWASASNTAVAVAQVGGQITDDGRRVEFSEVKSKPTGIRHSTQRTG